MRKPATEPEIRYRLEALFPFLTWEAQWVPEDRRGSVESVRDYGLELARFWKNQGLRGMRVVEVQETIHSLDISDVVPWGHKP